MNVMTGTDMSLAHVTPKTPLPALVITVTVNEDDDPVSALKRADRALADEGLNIVSFHTSAYYGA